MGAIIIPFISSRIFRMAALYIVVAVALQSVHSRIRIKPRRIVDAKSACSDRGAYTYLWSHV